jgi:hypothetical protein
MNLFRLPSQHRLLNLDLLADVQVAPGDDRVTLVFAAPRADWPGTAATARAFTLTYTFTGADARALLARLATADTSAPRIVPCDAPRPLAS